VVTLSIQPIQACFPTSTLTSLQSDLKVRPRGLTPSALTDLHSLTPDLPVLLYAFILSCFYWLLWFLLGFSEWFYSFSLHLIAYTHSLVDSLLPDGEYELVPSTVSGSRGEQPQPVGAHEDQGLSPIPAADQTQGKHRCISPTLNVLTTMYIYTCALGE
jgi:hypothetical protein